MSDYDRIARAIAFITDSVEAQPSLQAVADHLGMSPYHFQRLFSRWAGVTPKRFLQVLTLDRAKRLLDAAAPLLEVSETLGLSSGSRLYDHFVKLEAVTPGDYKRKGAGLKIYHALHDTPFGTAFIAVTDRGVCNFAFPEQADLEAHLEALQAKWPLADLIESQHDTATTIRAMFDPDKAADGPLSVHVSGTNFQVSVWRALLQIPPAKVISYAQVANAVGRPSSARAVGSAIGANPVAFLIPCHRVIRQCGGLGGFHWGLTRKQAMQAWETARLD